MPDEIPVFDEWCVVELFGHQRFAGRVRQAEWPPGFARLEIPATDGHEATTQLLSPQSIYRLTPTTEAVATAVAAKCRPEPVHRWELPAPVADDEPADRAWLDSGPFADDENLDDGR
jgi:hypothetical protein